MESTLILGISILLQSLAALLVLRLIWITGKSMPWILITAAMLLIAFRHSLGLLRFLSGDRITLPTLSDSLLTLAISVLMVAGIVLIKPLFLSFKQSKEALQKTKEVAEGASLSKSEFLAQISHEVRTPMGGIISGCRLLLETELSPDQREYAEAMNRSADHLLTMLNDILDLSKMEAGKLTLDPIAFDLGLTLKEAADLFAIKAKEKGLELIIHYPPNAPRRFVGDPGRIRQVLVNLVGNAIKFTEEGYVLVEAEYEEKAKGTARLRFTVEDTGIGIPEDKLSTLFDRFTQIDPSISRRYGGTGLGLAISKQMVGLMGGSIGVSSRSGQGSTFWFILELPVIAEELPFSLPRSDLSGVRVLIVGDNEINRRLYQNQTSSWGMRSSSSPGGEEALKALNGAYEAGDPYRIVIVADQMAGTDGETLGRAIKSNPLLSETLLIMLASVGYRGDAKRMAEAGYAAYLMKSFLSSQLFDALSAAWGAREEGISTGLITRHTLAESHAAKISSAQGRSHAKQPRVLVAEDHAVNQKLVARMLEILGCSVDLAVNGEEAVGKAEKSVYDLVFMDCQMPGIDGYQATLEIRRGEPRSRRIPIIAMTAHTMEGTQERCLGSGMDDYITKPFQKEDLERMLEKWVPQRKEQGEENGR